MKPMSAESVEGWVPTDDFGARLLLARRHAGLTVREAAVRCGVHYATWSTWERGSQPANMASIVQKISDGLGVDREWLMWGGQLANPHVIAGFQGGFLRNTVGSRRIRAFAAGSRALFPALSYPSTATG